MPPRTRSPRARLAGRLALALPTALVAACSSSAATPSSAIAGATEAPQTLVLASATSPALGAYLTGAGGMTLYTFTHDGADTSNCTGSCAGKWPPLTVTAGTTVSGPAGAADTFGEITRADGTTQVTYDHMPLYYYGGDSKAGDTTGQGVGGLWSVALLSPPAPSGMPASESPMPVSPAPSGTPQSQGYSQY